MCLIAYVPAGLAMPDEHMADAHRGNSDGIGVMSKMGVEKFVGRKALKRAKRYIRQLTNGNIEHAIHFRFATHGDVTRANCHPHRLPNGNGWLMHNGVLHDYAKLATAQFSDTALYAATHTSMDASNENASDYWGSQELQIGSNKLVVMTPDYSFRIVNEKAGHWIDKVWYSQTYSLYSVGYDWDYGAGYTRPHAGSRWSTYRTAADNQFEEWNPKTGQYEPRTYDPSVRRLELAYDRHTVPGSEWAAWERDKYGNDPKPGQEPLAEDKALDAELAKYLEQDDIGCCELCGQQEILDIDLLCETCAKELADEDSPSENDGMLPSWSNNSRRLG
jgi:hypothetical protein